mgnify:CR=1 FL=1
MKYFESNSDFSEVKLNTVLDIVRYLVTVIFLAPIRMCIEISRKILFTGEYLNKFLVNCLLLNSLMLFASLSYSFFVSKSINLSGGLLPVPSQVISLVIIILLFLFQNKYSLPIDFELYNKEVDLEKYNDVYSNGNVDEIEDELESPSPNNSEDEIEIIDHVNIDEQIDKMAKEISGTLSKETTERLAKLTEDLKKDMSFSSPNVNVASLYNSVKEKERECVDMITRNKLIDDESVFLGGNMEDVVNNNVSKRDFSDLLGDLNSRQSVEKALAEDIKNDLENADMQDEFHRAYREMNPVDLSEDPELYIQYENSFNMNVKADSVPGNPKFHKYSNKEWETPIGACDGAIDNKGVEDIMSIYNKVSSSDIDDEMIEPIFNFEELLDDEELL